MDAQTHVAAGIAAAIKNAWHEAEVSFRKALELEPDLAEAHFNLGLVFMNTCRPADAAGCFSQAISLIPNFPEAFNNLGLVLRNMGKLNEAEACLVRAIELNPDNPETYNNLGVIQARAGHLRQAETSFRRACELDPENPGTYNNLGLILKDLEQVGEAQDCFRRAIEIKPDYPAAYNNLGLILKDTQCFQEAEDCFRRTVELAPGFAAAYNNLATMLARMNRLEEAEACIKRALELNPNSPDAYHNLGKVLKDTHRLDEAEAAYIKSIELCPQNPERYRYALGLLNLLQGKYADSWEKYELRRVLPQYRQPPIRYWKGEDLTGKRILLFAEQGFGDTIQFVRYVQQIVDTAAETALWVNKPLERLIAHSLPNCTICSGSEYPLEYDFACSLHSLPRRFNTSAVNIPGTFPYLWPDKNTLDRWHEVFPGPNESTRCRIGVVWAGNPGHENDQRRTISFAQFSALFEEPRVEWVSLQAGGRADDLTGTSFGVVDISHRLVDFAETAAAVANLDLVIAVDTAVAHLAGAMGKEAWVLLPFNPDWRWQLDREDSPWYPTMRLFRQQEVDNWPGVIAEVLSELDKKLTAGVRR